MAILHTTVNYFARGRTSLELKPNSPSQRELVDTYTMRLWVHDQLVYDRIQSVRDWQMRHFYVEQIAKTFCCVRELIDKEISCPPGNRSDEREITPISPICAHLDTDWLKVALSAARTKRYGEIVHVNLYLQQAEKRIGDLESRSSGEWGEWAEMIWAIILCQPEDTIAFGAELLDEIRTAEQERTRLGISKYDDPGYSSNL